MKVKITGASNWVNRMFEACGNYQWARELLKNSLEAGASRVEFGIEWQAVSKLGVYRRMIADNGAGMSGDELDRFFSTLGEGKKPIGGVHDNFGVGAKIAALPWNPEGLVVISFKDGAASMIQIVLDPESGDYELVEFEMEDGRRSCVLDPTDPRIDWGDEINWGMVAPNWTREHGTVVVLMGSHEECDTILGNGRANERDIKGLSVYLNTRFWDLTPYEIHVVELRSDKKNSWPSGPDDRDDRRRQNNRRIMGARHFVEEVRAEAGALASKGTMLLDQERVIADWYLWKGERPAIHSYAKKQGYVAIRYGDELFELTTSKPTFRAFGIVENKIQQNLTIILEPQRYQPSICSWGVHPDQSRNRLIFTGNGDKGAATPVSDWALEFADSLPPEILEAIREARGEITGSIEDDEYRRRLQDRFGSRWSTKRLVSARSDPPTVLEATIAKELEATTTKGTVKVMPHEPGVIRARKPSKTVHRIHSRATPEGSDQAIEAAALVDIPRYRYSPRDEFEKDWHLAMWVPNDPEGPTVVLNQDAPILSEAIKFHQNQYPDVYAAEIMDIVHKAYGEIAVSKIAHSQKLRVSITEQELDSTYRSEEALTLALMGLLAEEAVISQRIKLGRKRAVA